MNDKVRTSPFAGTWYPREPGELRGLVESLLAAVPGSAFSASAAASTSSGAALVGIVAPHAGLVYSGPVAAHAYRLAADGSFESVILLGPSHQVFFDGLAVYPSGAFETPLGEVTIDEEVAESLLAASPLCRDMPDVHGNEHCLEMQLPFLQAVLPRARIVPVMMGSQSSELIAAAAEAIAAAVRQSKRPVLLVASSDLSHYESRARARAMDGQVLDCLDRFAPDALARLLREDSSHACGGGPIVSVMAASAALGADRGELLHYGDSGDTTGDTNAVVGYAAAAFFRPSRAELS